MFCKQYRKQPGVTNNPSNTVSSTSNIHNNFNENIDVASKESLYANPNYIPKSYVQGAAAVLIQTQPVSIPQKKL